MTAQIQIWDRLPVTELATLEGGQIRTVNTFDMFQNRRGILVGMPGAWTPICTRNHMPRYIEMAPSLLVSGFDLIACVTADSPWSLAEWSHRIDPEGRLKYFSDGNLDFGRATGLRTRLPELYLGTCLQRFVMIVNRGVVEKLSVEHNPIDVTCSAADQFVQEAGIVIKTPAAKSAG